MKDTANQRGRGQVIRGQVFESREEAGKKGPVIHLRVRTREKKHDQQVRKGCLVFLMRDVVLK